MFSDNERERQDIIALCEEVHAIRRNEPQRAWTLAQSAGKRARRLNDSSMIAESQLAKARCLEAQGKFSDALEIMKNLLNEFTIQENTERRYKTINMLGLLYYRIGDYNQALSCLKKAAEYFELHRDINSLVMSLNLMGNAYKEMGDYQYAIEYYFRSLRLAEEQKNRRAAGIALNNIGNAYYRIEEYKKARSYYEKSLEVRMEIDDTYGQAVTLGNLGNIFQTQGQYRAALECQEQSLTIRRELEDVHGQASALGNIANIYIDQRRYEDALSFLLKAQQLCERSGNGAQMAHVLNNLGLVHTELNRGEEALAVLERSLKIAEDAGMVAYIIGAHKSLAGAHAALGNYAEAYDHLRLYNELNESQVSREQTKMIADLQLRYELESAEKEKEIYRLRNVDLQQANREILEQKEQLERQALAIENANAQLTKQNAALAKLNDEKNDILGIAAHDLKNPLSSIALLGRGIQQRELVDTESREMASDIVELAGSMISLITNLLEINTIENGRIVLSPEKFRMAELLENIIRVQANALENKELKLEFADSPNDDTLFADCMRTRQIIDNLISNAIKYSEPGAAIFVRILSDEEQVTVEVEDEGPGISVEDQKRLFKKFQRLTARPTMGEHSSGLGLSIVKMLCEAMQGEVTCESSLGVGSCFRVSLPRRMVAARNVPPTSILIE